MSRAVFKTEACEHALRNLDAHLDGTVPAAGEQRLLEHLSQCADCTEELDNRARLRHRVRLTVQAVTAPPGFEARLRGLLAEHSGEARRVAGPVRFRVIPAAVAVASVLILFTAAGYFYGRSKQNDSIAAISANVSSLMRIGLGDHIHCAIFRSYPKNPPAIAAVAANLDPQYRALIPILRSVTPEELHLMIAHQCTYHGRRFVHLVLKGNSTLISLAITRKTPGESFDASGLLPALAESGISFYNASTASFHISAFETRDRLIYLISNMTQGGNLKMMAAMGSQLRNFFEKLDG